MNKQSISFGDTFSKAFDIWSAHFVKIIIVSAIAYLPAQILIEYLSALFQPILANHPKIKPQSINGIYNFIRELFGTVATIGIIQLVYGHLNNNERPKSIFEMLLSGLKMWPKFILLRIVICFRVALYLILLIIPGIYKAIRLSFADCIFVTKEKTIRQTCIESEFMVENNWWRIFGFVLLLGLFNILIELMFVPFFYFAHSSVVSVAFGVIIKLITSYAVVVHITYYFEVEKAIVPEETTPVAIVAPIDVNE